MLNKAILMGRLTADPELRHTPNNIAVTTFTLAVNRQFAKQGEQRQTDFIDIVAWRNTAEFVTRYMKKGSQVVVCGAIQTRTWKDKQDNTRKSVEIVADEVFFAEGKRTEAGAPTGDFGKPEGMPAFAPIADDDELPF
jgi:single-strand DNA-binding protein